MYDEANSIIKGVDNSNIFKLVDTSGKASRGMNYYDKTRNILVGTNTSGEISTIHTLTNEKKYTDIQFQVKSIINN